MFDGFPKSKFDIVSPSGEVRGSTNAIYSGSQIIVLDPEMVIQSGDEMRRALPNGTDETFEVVDPQFNQETFGIPPHFQIKVRRKGVFAHNTGGHFNITVSGPNARVNFSSTDNSTNVVGDNAVLGDLRAAIKAEVTDADEQRKLLAEIDEMEKKHGSGDFLASYQRFVSVAADHVGVIGPFLPALARLLS